MSVGSGDENQAQATDASQVSSDGVTEVDQAGAAPSESASLTLIAGVALVGAMVVALGGTLLLGLTLLVLGTS